MGSFTHDRFYFNGSTKKIHARKRKAAQSRFQKHAQVFFGEANRREPGGPAKARHCFCLALVKPKVRSKAYDSKVKPNKKHIMKISKWTKMLLSAGIVSLPAVMLADDAAAPAPSTVLTALSSTTLSGYVDTTAVWKFGTGDANMPGRVYDGPDVQDGFNLNVVSLTLDRPPDQGGWGAGYHVQMLMGPGAAKRGTGLIASSSTTEFAFNEAYVNLHVPVGNGLELHIGQFGTFNGYEAYDSYKNPNWSRSYGFFDETSAHTGIAAFYKVCDSLTLQAGVGNVGPFNSQVDARASSESTKAYLAMATLTAPDSWGWLKGATLSGGYTTGPNVSGPEHVDQFYVGGTLPLPVTGLSLGFAYDYTSDVAQFIGGAANLDGGYANATALYIMWQATEKLKVNTRLDYTSATQGWYYSPTENAGTAHGGNDQLGSLTVTADYSLWKNVDSRVEFRWDRSLDGTYPFGGTAAGDPANKNALSLALNIVYIF
jgi:hypothetical protein